MKWIPIQCTVGGVFFILRSGAARVDDRGAFANSFASVKEVLAKANPPKSGDDLAGVSARDAGLNAWQRVRCWRT